MNIKEFINFSKKKKRCIYIYVHFHVLSPSERLNHCYKLFSRPPVETFFFFKTHIFTFFYDWFVFYLSSQLRAYKIFGNPMNIKEVTSFSKKRLKTGQDRNPGNKICVCMCLLPNFSETVCRIVLILGGNIHLTPGQHLVMSICLSVRELHLDCRIFLDIWWKYSGQHIYVGRIILIFGGNIHLTPWQHINYISWYLSVSMSRNS